MTKKFFRWFNIAIAFIVAIVSTYLLTSSHSTDSVTPDIESTDNVPEPSPPPPQYLFSPELRAAPAKPVEPPKPKPCPPCPPDGYMLVPIPPQPPPAPSPDPNPIPTPPQHSCGAKCG